MKSRPDVLPNDFVHRIDRQIELFFEEKSRNGLPFSVEMARYHYTTGGKRLRASIPSMVFAVCGSEPESAIPLGIALELIHNATLVHDDLQDGDSVRRGKPTVWRKWSPPQAINCGDTLFQFAVEIACGLSVGGKTLTRVLQRLTKGTELVIEGQAQEFLMKDEESPGFERYLGVARLKTGALVAAAVGTAMEALDADLEIIELAENAALQAGLVFQLQDDLLDLYGEKQRDRLGTDIQEGKVSALIALFNERAGESDRKAVDRILRASRDHTSKTEIRFVLDQLERYEVKQAVLTEIARLEEKIAAHALDQYAPEVYRLIVGLADRFLDPIRFLL